MSLRFLERARRALLLLTYLSLACKLLIPAGYMPAAVSDGWPVKLCYSGLPENLSSHQGSHHEHNGEDDLGFEHCPLGALASTATLASDYTFDISYFSQDLSPATYFRFAIPATVVGFRSRAPPQLDSLI